MYIYIYIYLNIYIYIHVFPIGYSLLAIVYALFLGPCHCSLLSPCATSAEADEANAVNSCTNQQPTLHGVDWRPLAVGQKHNKITQIAQNNTKSAFLTNFECGYINIYIYFFLFFKGIPLDLGFSSTFKGYTLRNLIIFWILKGIPLEIGFFLGF